VVVTALTALESGGPTVAVAETGTELWAVVWPVPAAPDDPAPEQPTETEPTATPVQEPAPTPTEAPTGPTWPLTCATGDGAGEADTPTEALTGPT
jgi:hypothetical protein